MLPNIFVMKSMEGESLRIGPSYSVSGVTEEWAAISGQGVEVYMRVDQFRKCLSTHFLI